MVVVEVDVDVEVVEVDVDVPPPVAGGVHAESIAASATNAASHHQPLVAGLFQGVE